MKEPGAESDGPQRLHPAYIAIGAFRWLRALALPLGIALLSGGNFFATGFYAIAGLLGLLVTLGRIIEWRRFAYELEPAGLRVRSGLIRRQDRLVPRERIQTVELTESLIQRLFGVVGVKVETAAGGQRAADVTLEALRRDDALALRARLLATPEAESSVAADGAPLALDPVRGGRIAVVAAVEGAPIRALSTRDLLVAGATSAQVGPALALVVTALQLADDLLGSPLPALLGIEPRRITIQAAALILGVVAGLAWLLAIAGTVLTFARFELRRDGERLLISHGLLDRRRRSVPLARIQAVRVEENPLRQPFGLAGVRFESAGYGREGGGSGVLFPLLPRAAVPALLDAACPAFAPTGAWTLARPPRRAWRRYALTPVWWTLALALLGAGLLRGVGDVAWLWAFAGLVLLPPAALLGALRYRDSGWAFDAGDRFLTRSRRLGRTTTITVRRRVQRREVRQGPLQRRARLATFRAAVASGGAGGGFALAHLDQATAFTIARRLAG